MARLGHDLGVAPVSQDELFYAEWGARHGHCQCCGVPASEAVHRYWPGLSRHHILGGSSRSHEACNLLCLCQRCHTLAERPDAELHLSVGTCLTLKWVRERDEFDAARLAELHRRPLPAFTAVPAALEAEYRRWRPGDRTRYCVAVPALCLLSGQQIDATHCSFTSWRH